MVNQSDYQAMLLKRKNLTDELLLQRKHSTTEASLLDEVRILLEANKWERAQILAEIITGCNATSNSFDFDLLETDRIFHISTIREICIAYRLRFLESRFFKNGIPEEALTAVRLLEKTHDINMKGFMIAAPSKAFKLENYDDPLLFAPIGNGYHYLVHKWGNDLHPLRKWYVMPFRDLGNFLVFCLLASLIGTMLTPLDNLSKSVPMASIIIFLFMFKSVVAVLMYGFFMLGKNFNTAIWDSKFYNY